MCVGGEAFACDIGNNERGGRIFVASWGALEREKNGTEQNHGDKRERSASVRVERKGREWKTESDMVALEPNQP